MYVQTSTTRVSHNAFDSLTSYPTDRIQLGLTTGGLGRQGSAVSRSRKSLSVLCKRASGLCLTFMFAQRIYAGERIRRYIRMDNDNSFD